MKSENAPISDDEWLLRRVPPTWIREGQPPRISANAFLPQMPRQNVRFPDTTGISLYRESCLSQAEDILATVSEEKRHAYAIVRIPMSLLKSLDLSAVSSPDSMVLGHVVIPQLRVETYVNDKAGIIPIMQQLAKVASEPENIVLWPTPAPKAE